MIFERHDREKRSESLGELEKMKKNFKFCEIDWRASRKKELTDEAERYVATLNIYAMILNIFQADAEVVEQLRSDMQGLLIEVSDLSRRNDELMTAKDSDLVVIRDLDNQLKEYKRKYEQAKTELRSVKGMPHIILLLRARLTVAINSHVSAVFASAKDRQT